MKKRLSAADHFKKELQAVKPYIPRYYAVLIQKALPHKDAVRIYNVYHRGVVDYEVLREMQKLALAHPEYYPGKPALTPTRKKKPEKINAVIA